MRPETNHHPAPRPNIAAATLLLTALALSVAVAAEAPTIQLMPGSRLWLDGTSTLHAYTAEAKRLEVVVTPTTGTPADAAALEQVIRKGDVKAVELVVPVKELRSEKSGLEKNMKSALKGDKYPNIRFTMGRYTVADADTFTLKAAGTLSIAGVERPVDIVGQAHRSGDMIVLRGSKSLLMTDYGIKPPTMMMGTIKTGNTVVVHFELRLAPAVASALGATPRSAP